MINITLPDGSRRPFEQPVSVAEVAASIGAGLAKAALGGKVDGKLVDASHRIERDASLAIVTDKDPEGLDLIRHSAAHLLAYEATRDSDCSVSFNLGNVKVLVDSVPLSRESAGVNGILLESLKRWLLGVTAGF